MSNKKLTLETIDRKHTKEFSGKKRVNLKSGNYIDVQTKFKTTDIQNFIADFQDIYNQLKSKDANVNIAKDFIFVFYMLLLRHFTNLDNIPSDVESMIAICEKLINLNILDEILASFDPDEVQKVKTLFDEFAINSNFVGELFAQAVLNDKQVSNEAND